MAWLCSEGRMFSYLFALYDLQVVGFKRISANENLFPVITASFAIDLCACVCLSNRLLIIILRPVKKRFLNCLPYLPYD